MYRVVYIADGGPEVEFVDGPCPELWVRRGPLALCHAYDEAEKSIADQDPKAYWDAHRDEALWDARAAAYKAQQAVDAMDETICGLYEAVLSGGEGAWRG